MAARKNNARVIEVRSRAPVKPSETQYVRLPEEQPAELFEYADEPASVQYQDAALQGVLAELGERDEDAKVTVKRVSVAQGVRRMEWLFECHPSEFSVPNIQEWYGAGEFQCIVYGKQEGSNYKIVHANKKLLIGDPIGGPKPKTENAPALAGVPGQSALDVQRAVSEAVAGPLTALANTIAQMMPKPTSRADTFAELKQMGELFAMMRGAPQPAADPLAMLTQAVALVKNASPAPSAPLTEDGDLSPNYVLGKGIDLVQSFMQAHRGGAQPVPGAAPGAAPELPAPGAPHPITTSEADAVKIALKMQLGMLLHAAKMDADPETYSALIYEQAPDEVIVTLRAQSWFADLCRLEAGFTAFKPWAEKVRAQILEMIAEDAEPEGEEKAAPLTPPTEPGKSAVDGDTSPGLERGPAD